MGPGSYEIFEIPNQIPANECVQGDVLSFNTRLRKRNPFTINPYVCYQDRFVNSAGQNFENKSDQPVFKIGYIDLNIDQITVMENMFGNKKKVSK